MSILQAVAHHAAATPEAVAVEDPGLSLSYADLDRMSGQIAFALSALGAGPETLVAIFTESSVGTVATILGVLKTGAAYLPLDPALPSDRLEFILRDAGVSMLIASRQTWVGRGELQGVTPVVFTEDLLSSDTEIVTLPTPDPQRLVYVIYTSGSTGSPKGVEILEDGLSRFLAHMAQELEFTPADTMLPIVSLAFDVAVFGVFLPLWCGGKVLLLPPSSHSDGVLLSETIHRHSVTVVLAIPGTWQVLIESGWTGNPSLRAVSGGERITPTLARLLLSRVRTLWNHYGPTETTIAATTYQVKGDEETIPIGTAIAGLNLFLLDEDGRVPPNGAPGEIYISGPGLARGYRNREDLTAERFLDVSTPEGKVRAYRTGDVGRQSADGTLQFIGRIDSQVKIHGYRVELEEIESALGSYAGLREIAVVAHKRSEGDIELVAFVIPSSSGAGNEAELRQFAAGVLAGYMMPARFPFVAGLPRTLNGKVDKNKLLEQAQTPQPPPRIEVDEPENPTELAMLRLWRRLPGMESIGLTSNFFEHGGHSLLGARLIREVRTRFGVALPLSCLCDAPTARLLARKLIEGPDQKPWSPLVAIRSSGSRPPLYCVHGLGGNVLGFERLAMYLHPDQPVYGLQAHGVDGSFPVLSIEEIATRYIEAIQEVQPAGPYMISGYSAGGIIAFEIAHQLRNHGHTVAMLVLFDTAMHSRPPEASHGTVKHDFSRKFDWLASRVRHLGALKPHERFTMLRNMFRNHRRTGLMMRVKFYDLMTWCHLPLASLRTVEEALAHAIWHYQAVPYEGVLTLFKAVHGYEDSDANLTMGWDSIASSVLVEKIRANHDDLFREPFVRDVAKSLEAHIMAGIREDSMSASR